MDSFNNNPSVHQRQGQALRPVHLLSRDQHSGKWTIEEKQYADALATEFQAGTLDIEEGISLRRYLAQTLQCSAKRISKKYEGSHYNGKMLYQKSDKAMNPGELLQRRARLQALEKRYRESLKVLKMVEESKRNSQQEPSIKNDDGTRNLPPSVLLSLPAQSAATLQMSRLPSPTHSLTPRVAQLRLDLAPQQVSGLSVPAQNLTPRVAPIGPEQRQGIPSRESLVNAYATGTVAGSTPGLALPLALSRSDALFRARELQAQQNALSVQGQTLCGVVNNPAIAPHQAAWLGSKWRAQQTNRLQATLGRTNSISSTPGWEEALRARSVLGAKDPVLMREQLAAGRSQPSMLLPTSITTLRPAPRSQRSVSEGIAPIATLRPAPRSARSSSEGSKEGQRGGPSAKKEAQNALLLKALMNRKTSSSSPSEMKRRNTDSAQPSKRSKRL